jgi:hypothetical protein
VRLVQLSLPAGEIDEIRIADGVKAEIGRNPALVLGSRYFANVSAFWELKIAQNYDVFAFEVEDVNQYHVQALFRQEKKKGQRLEPATHVFLLSFHSREVTADDLKSAIHRKISPLECEFEAFWGMPNAYYLENTKPVLSSRNPHLFDNLVSIISTSDVTSLGHSIILPRSESHGHHTLEDCFAFFSELETLDENNEWFCPHCREFVRATKQVGIWSLPEVMVIQLKRFTGSGWNLRKNDVLIKFPERIDMAPFIVGPQPKEECLYRLYAVSNHSGGLGGGHYTAHAIVQNPFEEPDRKPRWYHFNDSWASTASGAPEPSPGAYVLFYERILPDEAK